MSIYHSHHSSYHLPSLPLLPRRLPLVAKLSDEERPEIVIRHAHIRAGEDDIVVAGGSGSGASYWVPCHRARHNPEVEPPSRI